MRCGPDALGRGPAGLAGTAGVIEPGAAADIVAVAGDPLQDIECLQQVQLVIQGGQVAWDGDHLTWDRSTATA